MINEQEAMDAMNQWKEIAEDQDLDLTDML
jgi:hypothetical protein